MVLGIVVVGPGIGLLDWAVGVGWTGLQLASWTQLQRSSRIFGWGGMGKFYCPSYAYEDNLISLFDFHCLCQFGIAP